MNHSTFTRRVPLRLGVVAALVAFIAPVIFSLSGCSPEFNWRDMPLENGYASAQFPGKPSSMQRSIKLGLSVESSGKGETPSTLSVDMKMWGAKAGQSTFTVGLVTLTPEQQSVGPVAIRAMREQMLRNIQAEISQTKPAQPIVVPRLDPGGRSMGERTGERIAAQGKIKTDTVQMRAAFVQDELRLYQWVVLGPTIDEEVANQFLQSFRLRP